jgi:hypothetical protein
MRRRSAVIIVAGLVPFTLHLYGQDQVANDSLQQKLETQFALTTVSDDRASIVTRGSTLLLQKDGLLMYAIASPVPPLNTYKDGKMSQSWARDFEGTMLAPENQTTSSYPHRKFSVGVKG